MSHRGIDFRTASQCGHAHGRTTFPQGRSQKSAFGQSLWDFAYQTKNHRNSYRSRYNHHRHNHHDRYNEQPAKKHSSFWTKALMFALGAGVGGFAMSKPGKSLLGGLFNGIKSLFGGKKKEVVENQAKTNVDSNTLAIGDKKDISTWYNGNIA